MNVLREPNHIQSNDRGVYSFHQRMEEIQHMNHMDQLKKQHEGINQVIAETTRLVNTGELESNAAEIAKNISVLAGKLQIHLSHEDRYLYPNLLSSENSGIKSKAQQYVQEMGSLQGDFTVFKNDFNTKSKIMVNPEAFVKAFKKVFAAIDQRMKKEDSDLYRML